MHVTYYSFNYFFPAHRHSIKLVHTKIKVLVGEYVHKILKIVFYVVVPILHSHFTHFARRTSKQKYFCHCQLQIHLLKLIKEKTLQENKKN